MSVITVERKILEKNDEIAARNREFFRKNNVVSVNIVSSPGAGKTSLLERTLVEIKQKIRIAVIEGDVQTDLDARRIAKYDVPVVQIVTNGGCHLDAKLVQDAIQNLNMNGVQLVIIENVGNLVCPANYDLGEHFKILVSSTTEGDDKPLKYPAMFLNSSVLVINKIDLLPYLQCDLSALKANALRINPELKIFEISCTTNQGISEWCRWIVEMVSKYKAIS